MTSFEQVTNGNAAVTYANCGVGAMNVILTFVAIRLNDRTGRQRLLLMGLVGTVASPAVLGVSTLMLPGPSSPTDAMAIVTLVCLIGPVSSFTVTWGPGFGPHPGGAIPEG